jgi:hypothetical protein
MLQRCYNQIRQVIGNNIIEPYESVILVDKYRQYWKPENKVRIILLAESHVFTSDNDRLIRIPLMENLPGYPTEYAKFVYCLAYGERDLTRNALHPVGDGTPDYWEIFYSCDNHIINKSDFRPILSATPHKQRLANKIALLQSLQKKGIWLVDSSIVALYDKGRKYKDRITSKIIRKSWDCYTRGVVERAKPEHIVCVGKGVFKVLENDINELVGNNYTVIEQPSHLSSEKRIENLKRLSEICRSIQRCTSPPIADAQIPSDKHCSASDERRKSIQEDRIKKLLLKAVSLDSVKIVGRYTNPPTYGVYDVGGEGYQYRFGNHPVRKEELNRQHRYVSTIAIFRERDDAKKLSSLLNKKACNNKKSG